MSISENYAGPAGFDTRVWRERGAPLVPAAGDGPLTGQTVAVKDLYAVAGYPLGGGVPEFLGEPEPAHAALVARLLAAGAEVVGIAQTDEFAYSITGGNGRYGMPVNPAAPQRVPGGSSSGSAVAVAAGEVSIGLGTDTAGSIRVPAAYQGLWGIRTSHGALPTTGTLPLAESFDTPGWLTRDVDTLAAVTESLLPEQDSQTLELVMDPAICAIADADLADATLRTAQLLGASELHLNADLHSWFAAFRTVQAFEAWANHGEWIRSHPTALEPEVSQRFEFASTITSEQASTARKVIRAAAAQLRTTLTGRTLLLPTTATLPPPRSAPPHELESGRSRTLHLTCVASILGGPAITSPLPPIHDIPNGICLLATPGMDRSIVRQLLEITSDTGQLTLPSDPAA